MKRAVKTYDVFLSYAPNDAERARAAARAIHQQGLNPFLYSEIDAGLNLKDLMWEALVESRAVVVVVSSDHPSPNIIFEIGAASAWNKPVYGVLVGDEARVLPSFLADIRLYPMSRVDDLAKDLSQLASAISDQDRSVLAELYLHEAVPTEQLIDDPRALARITKGFERRRGRRLSAERLLEEMIRMRKQGRWPRLRKRVSA